MFYCTDRVVYHARRGYRVEALTGRELSTFFLLYLGGGVPPRPPYFDADLK